ncbi:hypothetical protein NE235_02990 [Actinoallomurus spadix]|uniref:Uncharacterized protein n=1 Tax=Actinoallomurus spadix TaxID=79912 RepID=A0ABN0XL06_9ACTN|nr:hypothetical protein [Actinoallomurus spadix]MCO5985070.1 hypothetical protein [Actinoallomurus spadix]
MITAEELERERRRALSRLADLHREWARRHAGTVPYNVGHARPGPRGTDYAVHHIDVSATAEQEEEFQRLAAEVMRPFQAMAEEYARQQREGGATAAESDDREQGTDRGDT